MSDKDIIYPIIERVVNEVYHQRHYLVDRDEIASLLLKDEIARAVIEKSLDLLHFTEEQLWEKAGIMLTGSMRTSLLYFHIRPNGMMDTT